MTACEPALPSMEQRLMALNTGGSFSQFVRSVRRDFVAAATTAADVQQHQQAVAAC